MRRAGDAGAHYDAEKGRWVTTHEKKQKIHINENGIPDKGNPFIIAKMTGSKAKVSTDYRKKNLHALLTSGKTGKAVKALKDLDDGATIELSNGTTYTKSGSGFVSSKSKTGGKQTPQALAKILHGRANSGGDFTIGDPKPGTTATTATAENKPVTGAPASTTAPVSEEAKTVQAAFDSVKKGKDLSLKKKTAAIQSLRSLKDGAEITVGGRTWKKMQANIGGQVTSVYSNDGGATYTGAANILTEIQQAARSGGTLDMLEDSGSTLPPKTEYQHGQLGVRHDSHMGDIPLDIPKGSPQTFTTESGHEIVEAQNILSSVSSSDTTKDIIERQGFSGLPRRVSKEEFQKIAKQSGFVSKRTYCAASQEIADEYRRQLYEGDFYVDCSVGGAQYGQGMYCAADYTSSGYNAGIDEEMSHYQKLNINRQAGNAFVLGCSTKDLNKTLEEIKSNNPWRLHQGKPMTPAEHEVFKKWITRQVLTPEEEQIKDRHGDFTGVQSALDTTWGVNSATQQKFLASYKGFKKTEVITLDPSAKVISYNKLRAKYRAYRGQKPRDLGAFAAAMGYDAINAYGHGRSGSYTVILNRTKCVFMDRPINGDAADDPKDETGKIEFRPGKNGRFNAYRNGEYIGWVDVFIGKGNKR